MTSPVPSEKSWKLAPVEYHKADTMGVVTPFYRFTILSSPHDLLTMTPNFSTESLSQALTGTTLKEVEYATYLPGLYEHLFATNAKLFTRKYDPVVCASRTQHTFALGSSVVSEKGPYTCILSPQEIDLMNSKFYINWKVELTAEIEIDMEDDDVPLMPEVAAQTSAVIAPAPLTVSQVEKSAETIDLIEIDDVESDKGDTMSESSLPLRSGLTERQIRDRQRVEEARLRAKLAAFRAQRAMERYVNKYGDLTDSDGTEYTETEAESDESE